MKYLKYTTKGHNRHTYAILPFDRRRYDSWSVVNDATKGHNQLRRWLAILRKHGIGTYNLCLMWSEDGKAIRLLAYAPNNECDMSGYYAGIIKGEERLRRARKKSRRKVAA